MNFDEITNKIKNKEPLSFLEGKTWLEEGILKKQNIKMKRLMHSQIISEEGMAGMIWGIRELNKTPGLALTVGGWDLGRQNERNLQSAFSLLNIKKKKLFLERKSFSQQGMKLLFPHSREFVFFTSHPENAGFLARLLHKLGDEGYVFGSPLLKDHCIFSPISYVTRIASGTVHSDRVDPAAFALPPWNAAAPFRNESLSLWMAGLMTAAVCRCSLLEGIDQARSAYKNVFLRNKQ